MSILRLPSDEDIRNVAITANRRVQSVLPDVAILFDGAHLPRTVERRFYAMTIRGGRERVLSVSRRGVASSAELATDLAVKVIAYWSQDDKLALDLQSQWSINQELHQ